METGRNRAVDPSIMVEASAVPEDPDLRDARAAVATTEVVVAEGAVPTEVEAVAVVVGEAAVVVATAAEVVVVVVAEAEADITRAHPPIQ